MNDPILFATEPYLRLRDAVARVRGLGRGQIEWQRFPDGERGMRIVTPVRGRDVVLLAGATDEAESTAIFDLGCALVAQGAERFTLLMPYFAYATMDRASREGDVVTARTRAQLFAAIPRAACGNRITLLDPHGDGLPHAFGPGWCVEALPIEGWLVPFVRRLAEGQDVVLGSVDVGRAKWVERMASRLGVSAAFAHKRRLGPDRTEVVALLADVKDRHVILMDDMIRSGSSMLGAAAAYRAAGARRVSAYATHGVLPGDALARLEASGLLTHLTTTDSHPSALRQAGAFLEVLTIAPWLAAHLGDAHSTTSPERTVAIGTVP